MEDFSKYNGEGTVLRKAQLRMIDILVEIDKIFKRNNIDYWLDSGTLIGAVRHGGYIPWDDDIDIAVQKKDYKKIKEVMQKELPQNLAFQDENTDKRRVMKMGKVRDKNSYVEVDLYKRGDMTHQGVFVDILPFEPIVSLRLRRSIDFLYGRSFRRIRGMEGSKMELMIAYLLWLPANVMAGVERGVSCLFAKDKLSHVYGGCPNVNVRKKSDIFPLAEMEFEGMKFPVPRNYDSYLKGLFGDYMKIPSEDKRVVHATNIEFFD